MQQVTLYRTIDNQLFDTQLEAARHEAVLNLKQQIAAALTPADMPSGALLDWMVEYFKLA